MTLGESSNTTADSGIRDSALRDSQSKRESFRTEGDEIAGSKKRRRKHKENANPGISQDMAVSEFSGSVYSSQRCDT